MKERHYRAFITKINKSNGNEKPFPTASFTPYKYYIGRGNNSILVRAALKTRFWWSMGDFDGWEDYNFMWTQWKSNKIIESLKLWKDIKKDSEDNTENGEKDEKHSLASTHATDKDCNSSTENLITTPKRQAKPQALSALKKQDNSNGGGAITSIINSNSKNSNSLNNSMKPFSSGVAPRRLNT